MNLLYLEGFSMKNTIWLASIVIAFFFGYFFNGHSEKIL